jgi:hypothetical protein
MNTNKTEHRRLRAPMAVRRFALGVATGLVLAASLLAICMTWSRPAHSQPVGQIHTGGLQIDTLIVTDHLYLRGPGGTEFEINLGKDASGKDVVTATRAGG